MDAYNANPTSMRSAIESFTLIDHPAKLAILGDMYELGADSALEHKSIIELIESESFNCYFVGSNFDKEKTNKSTRIQFFKTKDEIKLELKKLALKGHLILLKGSRGVGLEDLVEIL